MCNIENFVGFISSRDGISDKGLLIRECCAEFGFVKDRSVYYCHDFAVRFSFSLSGSFSNTVLSLSNLKKYDDKPFLVCLVTRSENKVFLANSTFLKKISHSSHQLRIDNIKGSFNGSDIIRLYDGIENNRNNLLELFAFHAEYTFDDNLPRLVEATNGIIPNGGKIELTDSDKQSIRKSIVAAVKFCDSPEFAILEKELDTLVNKYGNAIITASLIENVNIRGRLIEYIIAGDEGALKNEVIQRLNNNAIGLQVKTKNTLGDYVKIFADTRTETDIKTKIVILKSNPKGYNIDKFLEYHLQDKSVFLFYFVGVGRDTIETALIPAYQEKLVETSDAIKHWAGRNSRGVIQFKGDTIEQLIHSKDKTVDIEKAEEFLNKLFSL